MTIILDKPSDELVSRITLELTEYPQIEGPLVSNNYTELIKEERIWSDLHLATSGGRYWSDTAQPNSPIYAGKLPASEQEIRRLVVDATYAKSRADLFASFGVRYLGRTYQDPRAIVLVNHKKGQDTHSPLESEELKALYTSLPEDWWGSFGVVSSSNVSRLDEFFDYLSETDILAYSAGAKAKLRFLGRDYAEIESPVGEKSYGLAIREAASRHRPTRKP